MNKRAGLFLLTSIALATAQSNAQSPASTASPAALSTPATDAALPQVQIAPAPAWVVPVSATAPEGKGGAVLRLFDVQVRSDANGVHEFQHSVIKLNTPASLQLATNLTVQWQPANGKMTVHTARLRRGGTVIDLLAGDAKFTTLRREAQLGEFQVNGNLTAFMPVSGLQVGDEVEFSFTADSQNPALAGHVEEEFFLFPGMQIDQVYFSESHPKASKVQSRFGPALPAPKRTEAAGFVTSTVAANAFSLPKFQGGDPMRQLERGSVQVSDFSSWAEVAQVMRPLFEKGATLAADSPIKAEAAKIAAANADPLARASAALRLVQREVRYFAELEGLGGYTPIPADTVWQRKIGDCKGKTVLLLALLHELGIDAEPLLVSTKRGAGTDKALPMPGRFDHVIVHARIGGKEYWLDGTRMDGARVEALESPDFLWGLPLASASTGLIPIPAETYRLPRTEWSFEFDATGGLDVPAKAKGDAVLRGDNAQLASQAIQTMTPDQLDEFQRTFWKGLRSDVTVTTVTHRVDPDSGEVHLSFTGTAKLDWSRTGKNATYRYESSNSRIGVSLVGDPEEAPSEDTPIVVDRRYDVVREVILLPDDGKGFSLDGSNIDQTIGGIHYVRKASLTGNRFEVSVTQSSPRIELTVGEAIAADKNATAMWAQPLYLRLPPVVVAKDTGESGDAANTELLEMIGDGKLDQARGLIDARLSAKPRDPELLALSGLVWFIEGDQTKAARDLDQALAVKPRLPLALKTKAQLLYEQGNLDDALLLLNRAVLVSPDDDTLYRLRSLVREAGGDQEGALADRSILVSRYPEEAWPRWDQVRLLLQMNRGEEALASARELRTLAKNDEYSLMLLVEVLVRKGQPDEARKELLADEKGKPNARTAGLRLSYGLWSNADQLLSDASLVVRTDPAGQLPDRALEALAKDTKRLPKLLAVYDEVAKKPGASQIRIGIARGLVERAAGNPAALDQALTAASQAGANNPEELNEVCWLRAIWRVDLSAARAACEAALKPARMAAAVDSLAMVELQSGNFRKAVDLYSEALRLLPESAPTLFGRGMARLALGDTSGQKDLALARRIDPDIDETFARYGFKPKV